MSKSLAGKLTDIFIVASPSAYLFILIAEFVIIVL